MVWPKVFAEGAGVALASRTAYGLGGRAERLCEPVDLHATARLVAECRRRGLVLRVLGGGSNLLVGDGPVPGLVLATRRLRGIEVRPDVVVAGAGESFPAFVRHAPERRVPGLASCAGIPGSVGGAVAMNAGGRDGTVAEVVAWVEGVDARGRSFRRAVDGRDFGYRTSAFGDVVLTRVAFRRTRWLDAEAERQRMRETLSRKRATQPLGARSAGCVFRNPAGGPPAGRLIDEVGLKGCRVGGAVVSTRHANFIVNEGGATARDVRDLIALVRETVRRRKGILLDLEVRLWP